MNNNSKFAYCENKLISSLDLCIVYILLFAISIKKVLQYQNFM